MAVNSIKWLALLGDLRPRQQFESQSAAAAIAASDERTRTRFRFLLNGDIDLQNGWAAGFALETAQAADSGHQTFENGGDDYHISFARACVSYTCNGLLLVGGKQKNFFYTTDLVWDGDINPQSFKSSASCNPTEFAALDVTYMETDEKDALSGNSPAVANLDHSDLFQLDPVLKS